jgi:hypothetical protein
MNRIALLLCFLSLPTGAQVVPDAGTPEAPPDAGPGPSATAPDPCLSEDDDAGDADVLGALRLSIEGETRALAGVELKGLERLSEQQVRTLARIPAQGPLSPEKAAIVLERLSRTGLFVKVTPTVRLAEGAAPTLVVSVEEQPYVTSVDIQNVHAEEQRDVQDDMFRLPPSRSDDEDDDDDDSVTHVRIETERGKVEITARQGKKCPAPNPPKELLAYFERGEFHPGFVWRGLPAALERTVDGLQVEGYPLASLDATLTPEGHLEVRVDEGRVEAVEVRGVDEAVAEQVREVLGIKPGDILLRSDLRRAAKRVESEMPFLSLWDVETLPSPAMRIVEERDASGARHYRPVEVEKRSEKKQKRGEKDLELSWEKLAEDLDDKDKEEAITTEGRRVVVHVRPRGPSFDVDLIPMHTQVTGFAPGLSTSLKLWDVRNRAHLMLDGALTIPLRWGGQRVPDAPEQTRLQRRLNWQVGARVQVPVLRLAEVGAQLHDFTDTFDRWRLGAIDSYLYSALINRPDAEYFRRRGYTAFATWRLGSKWLAGADYRRDTYESLVSFSPPFSLFRRDSSPFPNPEVDEGRMASMVGRVEYASDAMWAEGVGSLSRTPELSLLQHDWAWPEKSAVRSLLTVEVGNPQLGGDAQFRFWKVVSDNVLYVHTRRNTGLRLRVRAAGGRDLPLQKQEALGGWTALRGYAFKEFRGDASLLASAEYRWSAVGLFADVGTVHRGEDGWMDPRLGVGALLYLGDSVRLTMAWRTDERASLAPEARLLFVRPF